MKIAVLGCGTVGGGVVKILLDGVDGLELVKILDLKEKFDPKRLELYTDDPKTIFNDPEIDTVVEVMGGHDFSYYCIKNALVSGKNVVTANKEVIALHLKELTQIANEKGVYLMYEASAGGGIPVIKPISNLAKLNKTSQIFGILNGTTNFILTKMQDDGLDYDSALAEAKRLGFAEANPTADVEGFDMMRKICILSMLCYKQEISITDIYHFGITNVSYEFIKFVNNKGYDLKYMCFSENKENNINIGVEPVLVKKGSVYASVKYETNFVCVKMNPNDELLFVGKGAGRMPTAAAVVADIVTIRDKGEKMLFENVYNKSIGLDDAPISAVVDDGKEIKLVENVNASEIRNKNYKFYARILEN